MTDPLTQAPTLTTARLILRGPLAVDLEAHIRWVTTSARMGLIGGNGTQAEARFAFLTNIGRWQMDGMGFFTVTAQDDPLPLGRIGLLYYPVSDVRSTPEVEAAWFLYDGAEGHGYATEAATEVKRWGRQDLGLTRIVSFISPDNARSQATARRLAAVTDGTRAAHDTDAEVWEYEEAA